MPSGFTFNGVHSRTMNIKGVRAPRNIFPERKTEIVEIPFKSLPYAIPDESYRSEVINVECFLNITEKTAIQIGREWINWLQTPTWVNLVFDDDPTFVYRAVCNGPVTIDDLRNPIVTLSFVCAREED